MRAQEEWRKMREGGCRACSACGVVWVVDACGVVWVVCSCACSSMKLAAKSQEENAQRARKRTRRRQGKETRKQRRLSACLPPSPRPRLSILLSACGPRSRVTGKRTSCEWGVSRGVCRFMCNRPLLPRALSAMLRAAHSFCRLSLCTCCLAEHLLIPPFMGQLMITCRPRESRTRSRKF